MALSMLHNEPQAKSSQPILPYSSDSLRHDLMRVHDVWLETRRRHDRYSVYQYLTAVFDLVMEVTIRTVDGVRESKAVYLSRIMQFGSDRAKMLKLADRISNITALGFVHDQTFIARQLQETREFVLPFAETVNADMFRELSDLVVAREQLRP